MKLNVSVAVIGASERADGRIEIGYGFPLSPALPTAFAVAGSEFTARVKVVVTASNVKGVVIAAGIVAA